MIKAVFDTNILIDYLIGLEQARNAIKVYENPMISRITWMEVLIGGELDEQEVLKQFLNSFKIIDLTPEICELAINIRREFRVKLPDAIIWATAKFNNALLVTRNSEDFPSQLADIKIPYVI
jgi:predicted nucleic acid-binding protein